MNTIITILSFIILLSIIVVIHELGHLLAAKFFNVYCQEFSIGMGPKIYSKKIKETTYSIRALPLGGFVAMAGDQENDLESKVDTSNIPFERTLKGISKVKQAIIMYAGIFFNFILAILLTATVLVVNGQYVQDSSPIIETIQENSSAQISNIMPKDKIIGITVNDVYKDVNKSIDFISHFNTYDGNGIITLKIIRDNNTLDIDVKPTLIDGNYLIGITYSSGQIVNINLFNCLGYAIKHLFEITLMIFAVLKDLFVGKGLNNLSGPIGIYATTKQAIDMGFINYINLIAILSLNIGIMNALPLPILDGGRVLILVIEAIIKKELNQKFVNGLMYVSIILLIVLLVFSSYQDILRLLK